MKKYKILCTGNPADSKNIAHLINNSFADVDFIYLSNGYDLTTNEGLDKFKTIIGNYNVFFNFSNIGPGVQETLLKITHSKWDSGYVISLGSLAEYVDTGEYADSKRSLCKASMTLCGKTFKTSHITIPGVADVPTQIPTKSFINILETILTVECNIGCMTLFPDFDRPNKNPIT